MHSDFKGNRNVLKLPSERHIQPGLSSLKWPLLPYRNVYVKCFTCYLEHSFSLSTLQWWEVSHLRSSLPGFVLNSLDDIWTYKSQNSSAVSKWSIIWHSENLGAGLREFNLELEVTMMVASSRTAFLCGESSWSMRWSFWYMSWVCECWPSSKTFFLPEALSLRKISFVRV